ncbi:uncharacterized protein LAJ45_06115 [Morchella importuna]|uniref:Uncharacterized protein n=1 Tax=Morchella conica CCBAS932 TaxID=1392247 RepID=A0A3N4LDM5_9PEZI|nr:uncharacterized protein LAJ45_06115 [Morchella importuna]KAH8149962.1 hypothetical protein LAJ45_06115 [Morchella importuna]RPB16045.1 hypothetical protein P167DRAFT_596105 [Morchella conica CCBAS932]
MVNFISLVITLFLVCVSLVGSVPVASEEVRVAKRTTDWGNYVFIASQTSGIIGQNLGLIASPGNRAACAGELWDLQACAAGYVSLCTEERWAFEWCIQHVITVATCGAEWLNMTLGCMGESSAYCVETLFTLETCANLIEYDPAPPLE